MLDAGYPNIVHTPGDTLGSWRLWYSSAIAGTDYATSTGKDRKPGWLFANSSDGIVWEKPKLGLYNLSQHCSVNPELCSVGTANNVVNAAQGAGIMHDPLTPNASERYKAYWGSSGGTAVSPNGLSWTTGSPIHFKRAITKRETTDAVCAANVSNNTDCATTSYKITRGDTWQACCAQCAADGPAKCRNWVFAESNCHLRHRCISGTRPKVGAICGIVGPSPPEPPSPPAPAPKPSPPARGHQAYDCHNNLVWDWHTQSYLMTTRWYRDSPPIRCIMNFFSAQEEFGGFPSSVTPTDLILNGTSAHQLYSQITFPYYDLYLGLTMVFDTKDPATVGTVECHLSWSRAGDPERRWHMIGGGGTYNQPVNGSQFIPRGKAGAFDSHIIFGAAHPVPVSDEGIRIYYMGGNGPHNGPRNTSLGLAMLRDDGFIAVGGNGIVMLQPVQCGHALALTLDIMELGGLVRVGVVGESDFSLAKAVPLTANATRTSVRWLGGGDLSKLANRNVTLELELRGAQVYTLVMLE
eukprot:SAG31_NODE_1539_length_7970_cov_5.655571_5_plen_523_part_00